MNPENEQICGDSLSGRTPVPTGNGGSKPTSSLQMRIVPLEKKEAEIFVKNKHYTRKPSMFWAAFGLAIEGKIEGVCVFGGPPLPIQQFAFKNRDFKVCELSRLVVQTPQKNAASFLVSHSLKMLEAPMAVVSYADTAWGHAGIIYQATNWIYTGAVIAHDKLYVIDGVKTHARTLSSRGILNKTAWARENNIEMILPKEKHRYFFFVGNKK